MLIISKVILLLLCLSVPLLNLPILPDPWTGGKWAVLMFSVPLMLLLDVVFKKKKLFLSDQTNFIFLIALVLIFVSSFINLEAPYFWQASFFQLIWLPLAILCWPQKNRLTFEKKIYLALSLSWLAIFFHFIKARVLSERFVYHETGQTYFGNHNMAAEFAVLLLGLFCTSRLKMAFVKSKWLSRSIDCFLLFSLSLYIPFTFCRSAVIALVAVFLAALFIHYKKRIWLPCSIFIGGAAGYFWTKFLSTSRAGQFVLNNFPAVKANSASERWRLLKATLNLIWENPWGLGIGQFEFGASPWIEKYGLLRVTDIFKSPHSEPLRLIAENGWPFALLLLALCILYLKSLRFKRMRTSLPFFAAFAVQAVFQFPLEVPASAFIISIGMWKYLRLQQNQEIAFLNPLFEQLKLSKEKFLARYRLVVQRLVLVLTSLAFVFSLVYIFSNMAPIYQNIYPMTDLACQIDPYNWRNCTEAVHWNEYMGNRIRARSIITQQMRLRNWNFSMLRDWSIFEAREGNLDRACEIAQNFVGMLPDEINYFDYCAFVYVDKEEALQGYPKWITQNTSVK